MVAMEDNVHARVCEQRHFEEAIQRVVPRVTAEMIRFYDDFEQRSGLTKI